MYRTFVATMLGLGLGLLLLSPVNAEDTFPSNSDNARAAFSTLKDVSAVPMNEAEMTAVVGKFNFMQPTGTLNGPPVPWGQVMEHIDACFLYGCTHIDPKSAIQNLQWK